VSTPAGRGAGASREERLRNVVARVARVAPDSFGLDDDLRTTLGLDSLSALRVAAGVEREFGVTIPDEKLHELRTMRVVMEYLDS
jgi:acyl carrier protein